MMCWQKELVFPLGPELAGSAQPVSAVVDRSLSISSEQGGHLETLQKGEIQKDALGLVLIWRMFHPVGKPGVNAGAHVSFG